jgi:hypothetical protein
MPNNFNFAGVATLAGASFNIVVFQLFTIARRSLSFMCGSAIGSAINIFHSAWRAGSLSKYALIADIGMFATSSNENPYQ